MSYNIYLDNTKPEDLVSKSAKKKLKANIKKLIFNCDDIKKILEDNKLTFLEKFYKKNVGFNNSLSVNVNNNEIRLYLDKQVDIEMMKQEREKLEKQQRRMELKQKLRSKIKQKKRVMTQQQYMKQMKSEKKLLNKDPRVTEEMKMKYNILRKTIPDAQFPNPVEMLDNKKEHMQNFFKYVMTTKQAIGNKSDKLMEYFDNDYVNYVACMYNLQPKILVASILKIVENKVASNKSTENISKISEKLVDSENEVEIKEIHSDNDECLDHQHDDESCCCEN